MIHSRGPSFEFCQTPRRVPRTTNSRWRSCALCSSSKSESLVATVLPTLKECLFRPINENSFFLFCSMGSWSVDTPSCKPHWDQLRFLAGCFPSATKWRSIVCQIESFCPYSNTARPLPRLPIHVRSVGLLITLNGWMSSFFPCIFSELGSYSVRIKRTEAD